MELDWLKDFLALAEHGNFSRAAEARHVTQPAFSRRVRALEEWIGTSLFERSTQGAALTAAGTAFQPFAVDLIAHLQRAKRETLTASEQQTASLSIAATHALSFTFFPGWISRLMGVGTIGKLNLISDTMDACEQAMLSGEVHFVLCHWRAGMNLRLDPVRYPSITVGRDVLAAVSAPEPNGRPRWPVPATAQQSTRVLGYSAESGLGRILASAAVAPLPDRSPEPVFTSHLAAALLGMARDGQGAAWLPLTLVDGDLKSGHLVRAGASTLDLPIEIRLFRSADCRNQASDGLWGRLAAGGP